MVQAEIQISKYDFQKEDMFVKTQFAQTPAKVVLERHFGLEAETLFKKKTLAELRVNCVLITSPSEKCL